MNTTSSKSEVLNPQYRHSGDEDVAAGRAGTQAGWYEFAASFCHGHDVLDVGCGLGKGLAILARTAKSTSGIDVDARLEQENIRKMDVSDVPTKSVDSVVCIDVIEHVEDDLSFVGHLARAARQQILLSTPNYTASRCRWPYHVREYMPDELFRIFAELGSIEMYKGPQLGDKRFRITHMNSYVLLNRLRVNSITGFPTRCYNKLLPSSSRIHSHLFLRVTLS